MIKLVGNKDYGLWWPSINYRATFGADLHIYEYQAIIEGTDDLLFKYMNKVLLLYDKIT